MRVVLLGSGNVATHLAKALQKAGHEIVDVWSRRVEHASRLANAVGGVPITDIRKVTTGADLYIIAVKDDTIAELASQLHLQNELIVHTSGSIHINVLETASTVYGVFYPLQTFSKNREVNFKDVTLCVEGCTPEVTAKLLSLASQLSGKVVELNSEKRMAIHVAAVFACNFTNFMYALSQKLLADQNLDFELIRPLILETAAKVQELMPVEAQTGPALRKDAITIKEHRDFLKNQPNLLRLYEELTKEIVNFYKPL
jgi:predicted short-subunit dehydrogenase-like oxidoreductase (DUF2520 family)